MKYALIVLLVGIFCFVLLASSYAQIGEVAGPLNFNVSIGSRQSLTLTIINGGSDTLAFEATPTITTSIPNSTAPRVSMMPQNGTIPAHSELGLNVTVYMPGGKNKAGMVWDGYVSTVEMSNDTLIGSGANVRSGALKIMTITAAPAKFQEIYILIAAIGVTVVGIGGYHGVKRMRAKIAKKKASAKKARKVSKRKRAAKKSRKAAARRKASRTRRRTRRGR
jgi:hypothetical protein